MYASFIFAFLIVVIKVEFVIMIIKFISSFFCKDIIKIAFNAGFLLLFDFCFLCFFNINNFEQASLFAIFLSLCFFTIIIDSSDIIASFRHNETVDNNNIELQTINKQRKTTKLIKRTSPHIPIGKTIKTKNIKSML